MSGRVLTLLTMLAAGVSLPSSAVGVTRAANECLNTTMMVTTASSTAAAGNTITATVNVTGSPGQRISRLHLDLEVQERTAAAWVPFVTAGHAESYTNQPGSRLDRTWTLREDGGPIFALLDEHVQMRVYAAFHGVCRGASLGGPLLFGLTAPA